MVALSYRLIIPNSPIHTLRKRLTVHAIQGAAPRTGAAWVGRVHTPSASMCCVTRVADENPTGHRGSRNIFFAVSFVFLRAAR